MKLVLHPYPYPIYLRVLKTDVLVFDQIFVARGYDVKIPFEVKNIIDCGANIGLSAVYFLKKFPGSAIVAIEPDTENFEMIKRNTEHYPLITSMKRGVWDKECYLNIKMHNRTDSWSFETEEVPIPDANSVHSITIDVVMKQMGWEQVDILKIDIEGAEKKLFSGDVSKWLSKVKAIFIELHEGLQPGVTHLFNEVMKAHNFSISRSRENLICIKN